MKKSLVAILTILFVTNLASAGTVPNCWDRADIVDGSFLITIQTDRVSKEELIDILDRADGRYIQAQDYPLVFDDTLIIVTQAYDSGIGEYRLPREELKRVVREELQPIADLDPASTDTEEWKVRIECNRIIRVPRPEPRQGSAPAPRDIPAPCPRFEHEEGKSW